MFRFDERFGRSRQARRSHSEFVGPRHHENESEHGKEKRNESGHAGVRKESDQRQDQSEEEQGEPASDVGRGLAEGTIHLHAGALPSARERTLRPHSMSNVEPSEIAAGLRPCDLDRFDPRVRLGRLVPVDARLDPGTIPFEDGFDISIGHIADVAAQTEALRLLEAIRSEVDALDATAKDHDRADLHDLVD